MLDRVKACKLFDVDIDVLSCQCEGTDYGSVNSGANAREIRGGGRCSVVSQLVVDWLGERPRGLYRSALVPSAAPHDPVLVDSKTYPIWTEK